MRELSTLGFVAVLGVIAHFGACADGSPAIGFADAGPADAGNGKGNGSEGGAFGGSSGGEGTGGGSGSGGFGSGDSGSGFGSSDTGSSNGGFGGSDSGGVLGDSGAGNNGGSCAATVKPGALPLASNYLAATVIADGGYAYSYDDGMGSTACLDATALCTAGATSVATPTGTVWGAGLGFSLNQATATGAASPPIHAYAVPSGDTGITYALSALPSQGGRLVIDDSGLAYCAPLTAASGTVLWSSFNTECWNGAGKALTGAPQAATHLQFQVTANAAVTPFDFCVTAVGFAH